MPLINYEATIREAFNKHGRMLGTSIEMLVPSMKGCKAKGYFFLEKEASLDHDITLAAFGGWKYPPLYSRKGWVLRLYCPQGVQDSRRLGRRLRRLYLRNRVWY